MADTKISDETAPTLDPPKKYSRRDLIKGVIAAGAVSSRNVWDFPLLNIASAMVVSDGKIERIRIAVNGAAARPLRLTSVKDACAAKRPPAATGEMAGRIAIDGAVPLRYNAYKTPLMRNLVKRAIGGVEQATWAS